MKVLILTDHKNHTKENSLYALARQIVQHNSVSIVHIATRSIEQNKNFFDAEINAPLYVKAIDTTFEFMPKSKWQDDIFEADIRSYDFVWLRIPPPLSRGLLQYIGFVFKAQVIVNDPVGIEETGSKSFLLNFREVCPPMRLCQSSNDILEFSKNFPIVLKPLREYGGRGIVRVDDGVVYGGKNKLSLEDFLKNFETHPIEYLAVKFLKNVHQGDKRIIVIDGQILGASLRLPAKDSWLCNVAMGGTSNQTEVLPEEYHIVDIIDPLLRAHGIIMYGVDTLVGDDGKRILSEINTTSIGGLPQIAQLNGQLLVEKGMDLLVNHVLKHI